MQLAPNLLAWLFLIASILAEIVGMITLRYTNGFTHILPSVGALASFFTSIWLMSISLKHIEMGITYAVWAGSTTAILALIGIVMYQEPASSFKLVGMALVVVGVIVLNLGVE